MPTPLPLLSADMWRSTAHRSVRATSDDHMETNQRGLALVELALVMMLGMMLAVLGIRSWVNQVNDAQARAAAVWMSSVHKAVLGYLQRHGPAIQDAEVDDALHVHGFANWRAPTLAELAAAGLLTSGMPEAVRATGSARIHVWKRECPGDACTVEALIHSERPLLDPRGQPDEAAIAQWLLAAEGEGAAVHPDEPGRLRGTRFSYSSALPDGSIMPPGTVGMAVTAEHQALWSFLRVRDHRDPDFQGNLSVVGDLHGGGDAVVTGQLTLGREAQFNQACRPEQAIAHHESGGLMVCRMGRWRPAGQFGGAYTYNSHYGCVDLDGVSAVNPLTGRCSCAPGTSAVRIFDTGTESEHAQPGESMLGRRFVYVCIG